MDTLIGQVNLAYGYHDLGRPKDGIPLVFDALEMGEKTAVSERYMKDWRAMLVRPTRAVQIITTSPLPFKLVSWLNDCSVGSMLIQKP